MLKNKNKLTKIENICRAWKELQKLIDVGHIIRKQGLEKNPKLINVGPRSFPEFGVINKNNYNWDLETCWKSQKIFLLTPA